jgi:hypothetical protein
MKPWSETGEQKVFGPDILQEVEISCNNSYQETLMMAPFEMLYGRRCRTLLFWSETGEQKVFGPDILQEAEKQVRMVRENLQIA